MSYTLIGFAIIISALSLSIAIVVASTRLANCISRFSEILKEYINKEPNNGRNISGEKLSAGDRKPETEFDMGDESSENMAAGVAPEDFSYLVSKRTKTAVPFGEDVEE